MKSHYSEVVGYANDTPLLINLLLMKADTVKQSFLLLALVVGVTICLFLPDAAEARPEFATELGKACSFCHIDPAGGGPRNRVGEIFEENYFEFPEDFDMEAVTEEAKEVVKQLTTSLDLQTAFIKTTHVDEMENAIAGCNSCHSSMDRFLLMQAEVTFNAQVSEHVRLTLSNNAGTTMNAFATVDAIPEHLYVKVGQFQLPFAIKQKDHNILVRHGYGLGSNKRDVGVELGGTAGKVFYNATLFNADTAAAKGGLGTIGAQFGPIRAGVSGIFEKPGEDWERLIGAFLTASFAGFSLEGEFIVEIGVKSPLSHWMPLILRILCRREIPPPPATHDRRAIRAL